MTHHPSFPPQSSSLSVERKERIACRPALQWFGTSPYSDVAKGISGDSWVALKRFRPRGRPDFCERDLEFTLKKWEKVFSHPNIQVFLGLAEVDHFSLALVTPWMDWNLVDYVHENPNVDKVALACQIASALEYMHSQSPPITHGNLRGKSNVLVGGNGNVYLSDVGINEVLSVPGRLGYEARWRAPEKVLDDQPNTPSCDVWSFGATTLEMYTGRRPFDNYPREENIVLAMERKEVPPRPRQDVVAERLWVLLVSCWSYEPSLRPSMAAVLSRISSLKGETGSF